ncbi:hypothetical protein FRC05_010931 [Tulasnella sp. 425]|nr:hypothetical protein FRC05_010931 [Tulasnella sp. 425]
MAGRQDHIPAFPPEFGEDKGEFFSHYDKIQDELDEEMVKRLKENLDGILVFVWNRASSKRCRRTDGPVKAGLFAGVNSAFLAITLALMQPDPLDDISSLLQQIIQGFKSVTQLPSITFTPSLRALIINGLFGLSLASALFASFFAVLGKQWLMFYRNRSGGGVDQQRWEQLRRSLGAERWGLVVALEVALPVFIQTALVIFTLAFVLFLRTMSEPLSNFVLVPLLVTIFLSFLTVGFSLWDYSCPFRTPLSEIVFRIPRILSAIARGMRKVKVREWMRKQRALRNQESGKGDGGEVVARRLNSQYDEEKGNTDVDVKDRSARTSPVPQDASQHHQGTERWRSLVNTVMLKHRQAPVKPRAGFGGMVRGLLLTIRRAMMNPEARVWDIIQGFKWGREIEEEQVLHVVSIMRVIRVSEDPTALYHAALNLRSITDQKLLALVCVDESTTRGLRECYLEVLEDLDRKLPSAKPPKSLLRETLGFGTALFHVALSAESFDDFVTIIGKKGAFLPLTTTEMSDQTAEITGETCRHAQTFLRRFMNLQFRRLGAQPVALTSTTLAVNALWYAINGIPHSQDIVYGDRFRDALASSDVSWAGLALLASVSNIPCEFEDVRQRKPYGIQELEWCRLAFMHVRSAYHLSRPTERLAEAIRTSLSSGTNFETNTLLFKFAWKLFTRDDDGDRTLVTLGEQALTAGQHLICAIEKSIRSSKKYEPKDDQKPDQADDQNDDHAGEQDEHRRDDEKDARKYQKYADARAMCFKAMMEHMGPRGGEIKTLKAVAWRQRLVLMTATAYMKYIMDIQGRSNKEENAHAKGFMEQIREAQPQGLRTLLTMGKEYADAKREFEATFSRFGLHDSAGLVVSGDSILVFPNVLGTAVAALLGPGGFLQPVAALSPLGLPPVPGPSSFSSSSSSRKGFDPNSPVRELDDGVVGGAKRATGLDEGCRLRRVCAWSGRVDRMIRER